MNRIWDFLNGKKVIIAEFYWIALAGINMVWFPEGLPPTYNKVYLSIGIFFSFIGLGHKVIKKTMQNNESN